MTGECVFLRAPLRFKVGVDAPDTSESSPTDRGLALLEISSASGRFRSSRDLVWRTPLLRCLFSRLISWSLACFRGDFRGARGLGARLGSPNGSEVVASHPSIRPPKTLGTISGAIAGCGLGDGCFRASGVLGLLSGRLVVSSLLSDLLDFLSRGSVADFLLMSFADGVLGTVISVDELFRSPDTRLLPSEFAFFGSSTEVFDLGRRLIYSRVPLSS